MANLVAVRPERLCTDKTALAGTLMYRRSDVLGVIRKLLHYADRNISLALDEGRQRDVEIQEARRRTLWAIRDGIYCLPMFENPDDALGIPYEEYAQAIEARRVETLKDGSVHESAVPTGCAQDKPTSPFKSEGN